VITAADDALHPPVSDELWWSETYYFNFDAPEADLSCIVYPWLRANLGVATCGVAVWQGFVTSPFQMRLYDWQQQLPMPDGGLPDVTFANGVSIECRQHRVPAAAEEVPAALHLTHVDEAEDIVRRDVGRNRAAVRDPQA
jgi:hypothetical protein